MKTNKLNINDFVDNRLTKNEVKIIFGNGPQVGEGNTNTTGGSDGAGGAQGNGGSTNTNQPIKGGTP
jgi:hypothetical protein